MFQLWPVVFLIPLKEKGHAVPHWKALSSGKYEPRGLSYGSTLSICLSGLLNKYQFQLETGIVNSKLLSIPMVFHLKIVKTLELIVLKNSLKKCKDKQTFMLKYWYRYITLRYCRAFTFITESEIRTPVGIGSSTIYWKDITCICTLQILTVKIKVIPILFYPLWLHNFELKNYK